MNDRTEGIKSLTQAKDVQNTTDLSLKAQILWFLAATLNRVHMGNNQVLALNYLKEAADLGDLQDQNLQRDILSDLATSLANHGTKENINSAIIYLKRAAALPDNSNPKAKILYHLGSLLIKRQQGKDLEEAIDFLREAERLNISDANLKTAISNLLHR